MAPCKEQSFADRLAVHPVLGTAEKTHSDRRLPLHDAIAAGYRIIDSGMTPAYNEPELGEALSELIDHTHVTDGIVTIGRNDLYIQAKYSPAMFFRNAISTMPYRFDDVIPMQVLKSFEASLHNLHLERIDVYFLHRPFSSRKNTYAAWEIMEELVRQGGVVQLGVCQVALDVLEDLYFKASIKPLVVQNYCGKKNNYDREVRSFCHKHGIIYQAFGLFNEVTIGTDAGDDIQQKAVSLSERKLVSPHAIHLENTMADALECGELFQFLDGSRNTAHLQQNSSIVKKAQAIRSELFQ